MSQWLGETAWSGAPGRIRTCDLWLRRPTLYPAELRARTVGLGVGDLCPDAGGPALKPSVFPVAPRLELEGKRRCSHEARSSPAARDQGVGLGLWSRSLAAAKTPAPARRPDQPSRTLARAPTARARHPDGPRSRSLPAPADGRRCQIRGRARALARRVRGHRASSDEVARPPGLEPATCDLRRPTLIRHRGYGRERDDRDG